MGIMRSEERTKTEIEEFRQMLLASATVHRRKEFDGDRFPAKNAAVYGVDDEGDRDRPVCVTSGLSFLGVALVDRLLSRGYSVRIVVDNPEDLDRIEEMEMSNSAVSAVMARVTEEESLEEAFKDCRGVFHTSSFIDPTGLSGYTKYMVDVEARASENVVRVSARTPTVKKCVMTSSLLACVWGERTQAHQDSSPIVINHDSWSDESLCIDKKLWYALGKLRAEKAAWRVAEEKGLNMATICASLITGPQFCSRNSTPTLAYLKGAQEMYEVGVLATVDVNKLAEAHVCVFEAMSRDSGGRYICFDNVIRDEEEAEKLARETGISKANICGTPTASLPDGSTHFQLSDQKLLSLMSTPIRPCYHES